MATEEPNDLEMVEHADTEQIQTLPSTAGRFYKQFSKSTVFASNDNCSNKLFIFVNDCLPLLHPFGPFHYFWDIFTICLLLYTCIEAPVSLAFEIDLSLDNGIGIFALFVDISLFIDCLITFRTAYFDSLDALKLIIDPKLICLRYLKSWFLIDILTCVPFQLFDKRETLGFELLFMLRFLKTLRMIKILRFFKMVHVFDSVIMSLTKQFSREIKAFVKLAKLIFFMLLFAHFSACCWWFVGLHHSHSSSWIDGIKEDVTSDFDGYSYAWYWAIVTLFTTGYGDIVATNRTEQWVSSVCIIIGTIFFSYFIGTLTVLITEGDKDKAYENARLEEAQSFSLLHKLPKELTRAILTHVRYHCQYNYVFNEADLLQSLPPYLQNDIHKYLSRRVLAQIDIFQSLNKAVLGQIALQMRSISCNEDYELFKVGDRAKEIYITRTGVSTMRFSDTRREKEKVLKRGHIFGEYALLSPKRKVSVECHTWAEFYILRVSDILSVLQSAYPKTWAHKWKKMRNVVAAKNYIKHHWFELRKVSYKSNNERMLSVTETTQSRDELQPLSLNNKISSFLHAHPSTVKTARFHGCKSIHTEWDGSIPENNAHTKDIVSVESKVSVVKTPMSVINENQTLNETTETDAKVEMSPMTTNLAELQRSQSDPHSSLGIFEKTFLFKRNSSIRHKAMSSAHKKKMSSAELPNVSKDVPYYYRSKDSVFSDSDDDQGDIGPGLKDIKTAESKYDSLIDALDHNRAKLSETKTHKLKETLKMAEILSSNLSPFDETQSSTAAVRGDSITMRDND